MTELMTNETPAKVTGLLAVALSSMFFLFAVCVTNANFSQTEKPFPDPFSVNNVVSVLDNVSNSYSNFLAAHLFEPAQNSYAMYQYNLAYVMDNAGPSIIAMTGLKSVAYDAYASPRPQVLGASTQTSSYSSGQGLIASLYALLSR